MQKITHHIYGSFLYIFLSITAGVASFVGLKAKVDGPSKSSSIILKRVLLSFIMMLNYSGQAGTMCFIAEIKCFEKPFPLKYLSISLSDNKMQLLETVVP